MLKILWLTNIPSPYRVDFFNELGKYCQLTVLFERSASSERDDSWKDFNAENFKAIFLKGKKIGVAEAFCPSVKKYLNKQYNHIVVTNFSSLTGMLAIRYMRRKHLPYMIESDGAFAGTGRGIKEKIKKYFISGAKLYFSTAKEHDKYYLTYGAPIDKIYRYPFTSIAKKDVLQSAISFDEKAQLKKKLGIQEKIMVLAVGQFIHRKGYDVLIKAFASISKDVGCYIVGGTPSQEYFDLLNKYDVTNVHFVDFKNKEALKEYYQSADIFVHPTREDIWGLVINEAMAQGLPVISTDRCIAALEMVKDGENGYIIPVDNDVALTEKIKLLTESEDLRNRMREKTLCVVSGFTTEEMVKSHLDIFYKV